MTTSRTSVLLLKTKSTPADGYEEYFAELDGGRFHPIFVPVLEHCFTASALKTIEDAIKAGAFAANSRNLAKVYGGFIFTSQRAVEAFTEVITRLRQENIELQDLLPASLPIYAVGPATARSLRLLNLPCQILGDETGNGEVLAHYMLEHHTKATGHDGLRPGLLFPVGEQRRDIIPKTLMHPELSADHRIDVEELTVYETGVMETFRDHFSVLLKERQQSDQDLWIVVFSPTGCKVMLEVLGMLDVHSGKAESGTKPGRSNIRIATIGPTTRDYLINDFSYEPVVCAPKPTAESLGEAILSLKKSDVTNYG
jgi:uroporphyrinogen-III synthase